MPFGRAVEGALRRALAAPYVHILFGARQTGKSTLLRSLITRPALWIDFSDPAQRSAYLADPGRLIGECRALRRQRGGAWVVIDEVQAVPPIFDAVQHLYDQDRRRWRFVLCGSSARKLRRSGANLLPGRSLLHALYPLIVPERPPPQWTGATSRLLGLGKGTAAVAEPFPETDLEERLAFGELPGVATAQPRHRAELLRAYALVYLEEELRREALIKDWAAFVRFLTLAAAESGQLCNYAKIAHEAGVSQPTVKSHYGLLEDMFVGFRLPAFSRSRRKNLLSTDRFFFFDLGVRHAAAGLVPGRATVQANPGPLFEQWVVTELWKRTQYGRGAGLSYLRAKSGMEIDVILEQRGRLTPIEIKWTTKPSLTDARHLHRFLDDHPRQAKEGLVVCRCERPLALSDRVTALPWWQL